MKENQYHHPLPRDDARTPEQAIKKIQYAKRENLYIYKGGMQVRRFIGEGDRINLPPRYLFELKDAILVHNHPGGSSFSWEDIKMITKHSVRECYLITERYIHHLKRPIDGWGLDVESAEFEKFYNACFRIADNTLDKMISLNEITEYDRDKEIVHYIWVLLFKMRNIEYVRKKFEDFQYPV